MASASAQSTPILIRSGIGGAGNYRTKDMSSTNTSARLAALKANGSPTTFTSSIGGAGNVHYRTKPMSSTNSSAKLAALKASGIPATFTTGIGGAGNVHYRTKNMSSTNSHCRVPSLASSSNSLESSSTSSTISKLKNAVAEHWQRRSERTVYEALDRKLPAYPGLFPSSADFGRLSSSPKLSSYE